MTRKQKLLTIIISSVVAAILIATLIITLVINNNREKTATTIMTCSVNPHVQFVLNAKNEVMQVVALNNEGQAVTMHVDFIGLDAEDAAEMFVKISTEAGYIDANTTGTKVTFDLNGSKKNYDKLEEKIVSQVNGYFDENGIIAGAITSVTEDLKESIKTLKPSAIGIDEQNKDELMAHYLEIANMVEGMEAGRLSVFFQEFDNLYNRCHDEEVEINEKIAQYEKNVADYKAQLETIKDETLKSTISEALRIAENAIKFAKQDITDLGIEFENSKTYLIETMKTQGQAVIENLKSEIQTKITDYSKTLSDHKTYFENNREEVNSKIAAFRATLQA